MCIVRMFLLFRVFTVLCLLFFRFEKFCLMIRIGSDYRLRLRPFSGIKIVELPKLGHRPEPQMIAQLSCLLFEALVMPES